MAKFFGNEALTALEWIDREPDEDQEDGIGTEGKGGESLTDLEAKFANVARDVYREEEEEATGGCDERAKWSRCLVEIGEQQDTAKSIREQIVKLIERLDGMIQGNQAISSQSTFLSEAVQELVGEKELLERFQVEVRQHLTYFDRVDALGGGRNLGREHMDDLDEAVRFFTANLSYQSSKTYLSRALMIQQRLLRHQRDSLLQHFRTVLQADARSDYSPTQLSTRQVKFEADLADWKEAIGELEQRSLVHEELQVYLRDVLDSYSSTRAQMLAPIIQSQVSQQTSLLEAGVPFLLDACTTECKMFKKFFKGEIATEYMQRLVEEVSAPVYEQFRAQLVQLDELSEITDLISKLRKMATSMKSSGTGNHTQWSGGSRSVGVGHLVGHILERTTQDAQERMIFRAGIFIRSVIAPWKYSYSDVRPFLRAGHTSDPNYKLQKAENFPTVNHTTELLEYTHNSLEKVVFESLAEEAVRRCTTQLVQLSELIVNYRGSDQAEYPELEASLFLIRHLQFLNYSVRDYSSQGDLSHVEKSIDFVASLRDRQFQVREETIYTSNELKQRTEEACKRFQSLVKPMGAGEAAEQAEQNLAKVREVTSFYITNHLSRDTLLQMAFEPLGAVGSVGYVGPPDAPAQERKVTLHAPHSDAPN